MIYLVGLGAGGAREMSADALGALRRARRVLLRTASHPAATTLRLAGIEFEPLDSLAPDADAEARAQALAEFVLNAARETDPLAYAVPGHPLIAELSVRLIMEKAQQMGIPVRIVPSRSFLEPVLEAVRYEMSHGLQLLDAGTLPNVQTNPNLAQIYYQLETPELVQRVKNHLLRHYPPDFPVTLVHAAGVEGATETKTIPLDQLDQQRLDPLTSLFVPPAPPRQRRFEGFEGLVEIVAILRSPEGCPWDREQTHESLKPYLVEEAYEVIDAIDSGDPERLCEELGDLLLQVVMHSQLARERGTFDIHQVIQQLNDKLVQRHPHVFGDVSLENAEQVLRNWDRLKREQKGDSSILEGIPRAMPALMRALEVSQRAARAGFEWENIHGVLEKLQEEESELRCALEQGEPSRIEAEIGDLLFTLVNVARHAGVDPEESLRRMVDRFIQRFRWMEATAAQQNRSLESLSPDEWEALWQAAKQMT
ncbi:Nucleoside triphosphate pyrophosphohydrolase/pyrophosphatase MazG [bacterium HR15]|nr:Nucleoside triphosphate pyrophosphohydrolase/pyrophosphatase MazG [bacterium HR15]